jgi:hypothetical protein
MTQGTIRKEFEEFKGVQEFEEFKERIQELESRSQEARSGAGYRGTNDY